MSDDSPRREFIVDEYRFSNRKFECVDVRVSRWGKMQFELKVVLVELMLNVGTPAASFLHIDICHRERFLVPFYLLSDIGVRQYTIWDVSTLDIEVYPALLCEHHERRNPLRNPVGQPLGVVVRILVVVVDEDL